MPSAGAGFERWNGLARNTDQRQRRRRRSRAAPRSRRARARAVRRRVEEQDQARPERQQPHPQQQRALLRGPHRGRAGRRRGVVVLECVRDHRERRSPSAGRRPRGSTNATVSTAASAYTERRPDGDPLARAACARRRSRRRRRRRRERERQRAGRRGRAVITSGARSAAAELRRALGDQRVALADEDGRPACARSRSPRGPPGTGRAPRPCSARAPTAGARCGRATRKPARRPARW